MRLGLKLLMFAMILANWAYAQVDILTLQPDSINGYDALIDKRLPNNNFGSSSDIATWEWTIGGVPTTARSLIKFGLDSLPPSVHITDAKLSLYCNTGSSVAQLQAGENESYLERILVSWDENTVTWNNQPNTNSTDKILLGRSASKTQNYIDIDITDQVKLWYSNPSLNFGLMLKLITEEKFRTMLFASSDHANLQIRPRLVITYQKQYDPKKLIVNKFNFCESDTLLISVTGNFPELTGVSFTKKLHDSLPGKSLTLYGLPWQTQILYLLDSASNVLDSAVIHYYPSPGKVLPHDTLNCSGGPIVLDASQSFSDKYLWSNGDASYKTQVSLPAKYYLTMTIGTCTYYDSVVVKPCDLKLSTTKNVLCANDSLVITISGNDTIEYMVINSNFTDTLRPVNSKINLYSNPRSSGVYLLIDKSGRTRDSIAIKYYPLPNYILPTDTTLCDSITQINIDASLPECTGYLWNDGSINPAREFLWPGKYSVTYDFDGCKYEDEMNIDLCSSIRDFIIPNVFTPNGDGLNDEFIVNSLFKKYEIEIYNRWGIIVFESKEHTGWNGNNFPDGTYNFILRYTNAYDKNETVTGTVTLIR